MNALCGFLCCEWIVQRPPGNNSLHYNKIRFNELNTTRHFLALLQLVVQSPLDRLLNMKNACVLACATSVVACFFVLSSGCSADTTAVDYPKILDKIRSDVADLAGEFPQLQDFPEKAVLYVSTPSLSYSFQTHQSRQAGGWTAGVPNPDEDGIWFYIDFHEPDSSAQIHTQPMTLPLCLGSKNVSFLILEGNNTKSVEGKIHSILKKYGVSDCRQTRS